MWRRVRIGLTAPLNPLAPQRGNDLRLTVNGHIRKEVVQGPSSYEAQLEGVRATIVDGTPFPFAPDDFVRSMEAIDKVQVEFSSFKGPNGQRQTCMKGEGLRAS